MDAGLLAPMWDSLAAVASGSFHAGMVPEAVDAEESDLRGRTEDAPELTLSSSKLDASLSPSCVTGPPSESCLFW